MASLFGELFENATEFAGRTFPTEAAAREGLRAFTNTLDGATPVDDVMKSLFTRAAVRRVTAENGEHAFGVLIQPAVGTARQRSALPAVIRGLRNGDLESVARSLDIDVADLGSRTFRDRFKRYARDVFPDTRLAEQVAAAEGALPSVLSAASRDLRPSTAQDLLLAMRRDKELDRLVRRLAEHVDRNGGRRFRYASTFFVLTGVAGSATAVAAALHEQAKRAAGCWRVYLDPATKRVRGCKIVQASCLNRETNENAACDRTPTSFGPDMCRDAVAGDECVHCDSAAADPASTQYVSSSRYLEAGDLYVCKPVASVGEMLGRVFADVPELARDVVGDVTGIVSRVWDAVKYFLLAAAGIIVAGLSFYAVFTARGSGGVDWRRAAGYAVLQDDPGEGVTTDPGRIRQAAASGLSLQPL